MRHLTLSIVFGLCWILNGVAWGQFPEPLAAHELLKKDVGTWKATLRFWMGPDGKADPTAEPAESTGEEVNRMIGQFWVVSSFKGEFGGMPFEGHGTSGYDPKLKKYVGSWVDSVSPFSTHMLGTYDEKTKTLTSSSVGVGMDGEEVKGKSEVIYIDDDHRRMVMYDLQDGKEVKSMEIEYVRVK